MGSLQCEQTQNGLSRAEVYVFRQCDELMRNVLGPFHAGLVATAELGHAVAAAKSGTKGLLLLILGV